MDYSSCSDEEEDDSRRKARRRSKIFPRQNPPQDQSSHGETPGPNDDTNSPKISIPRSSHDEIPTPSSPSHDQNSPVCRPRPVNPPPDRPPPDVPRTVG